MLMITTIRCMKTTAEPQNTTSPNNVQSCRRLHEPVSLFLLYAESLHFHLISRIISLPHIKVFKTRIINTGHHIGSLQERSLKARYTKFSRLIAIILLVYEELDRERAREVLSIIVVLIFASFFTLISVQTV